MIQSREKGTACGSRCFLGADGGITPLRAIPVSRGIHRRESNISGFPFLPQNVLPPVRGSDPVVRQTEGPLTGMLGTLQRLGIRPSFGRPSVSNDNAYSESLFKTLKEHPEYPVERPFDTLEESRKWISFFVGGYNDFHRHSAIKFVTPSQRNRGEDRTLLHSRERIYREAQQKNPERWSGKTRDWTPIEKVTLNPQQETIGNEQRSHGKKSKNVRQIA